MRIAVITDHHYKRLQDGSVYVPSTFSYGFWTRYMDVFDEVVAIVRGENVENVPDNMVRSSGKGVEFVFLPNYYGIAQYIDNYVEIHRIMYETLKQCDCAVIRIPSAMSRLALSIIKKLKMPYVLEMVGDPEEAYKDRTKKFSIRNIIKSIMVQHCRTACLSANGVSYVTEHYLQSKFPSYARLHGESRTHFESFYSSVVLSDSYLAMPKEYECNRIFNFIHVSNDICNNIKGHAECIEIIKKLRDAGFDVRMDFVGDGDANTINVFYKQAEKFGIRQYIHFAGLIGNPSKLREKLIDSDIYLFPSKAEGLPRTVIEAMACGLVCVTSNVCGTPEIVEPEYVFDYFDINGFADKLKMLLTDKNEMNRISARNIEKAREFTDSALRPRRNLFYRKLKGVVNK